MNKAKYEIAVGLRYNGNCNEVPSLSVNSDNLFADEIVRIARRYGVPVVEREQLARALKPLPCDADIPEHLFEAVALVLHQLESHLRPGS